MLFMDGNDIEMHFTNCARNKSLFINFIIIKSLLDNSCKKIFLKFPIAIFFYFYT